MYKKILLFMIALLSFTACSANKEVSETENVSKNEVESKDDNKKNITVTTTFIEDMVHELIGNDKANIELIIPAGEDPHIYVPKPEDFNKLTEADLVLYHGIHFEGKMVDALEGVGYAVTESFDKNDIGEMEDAKDASSMVEDPHFWFDLDLYAEAFTNAANKLKELYADDSQMLALIDENHDRYLKELKDLDKYNGDRIAEIPEGQRYLITPHDAFNYFSRRYDMTVMAPQGVTTDSEVANKDLEDTAQFIADKKIKAIFAESTTNPERMEKLKDIVKSKGFETEVISGHGRELLSDSLADPGEAGDNFIDMYKHNVDLIVDNLK